MKINEDGGEIKEGGWEEGDKAARRAWRRL
jgi:hypothetical protein